MGRTRRKIPKALQTAENSELLRQHRKDKRSLHTKIQRCRKRLHWLECRAAGDFPEHSPFDADDSDTDHNDDDDCDDAHDCDDANHQYENEERSERDFFPPERSNSRSSFNLDDNLGASLDAACDGNAGAGFWNADEDFDYSALSSQDAFVLMYQRFCMGANLSREERKLMHRICRGCYLGRLTPSKSVAEQERATDKLVSKYLGETEITFYCPNDRCSNKGQSLPAPYGVAECCGYIVEDDVTTDERCDTKLNKTSFYGKIVNVMPRSQLKQLLTHTNLFPLMLKSMVKNGVQNVDQLVENGAAYQRIMSDRNFATKRYSIGLHLFSDEAWSVGKQQQLVGLYMGFRDLPNDSGLKSTFHVPLAYTIYHKKMHCTPSRVALFEKVAAELNDLYDNPVNFVHKGENYECPVFVSVYFGDLPETQSCLNMIACNGKNSCHICRKKLPYDNDAFKQVDDFRTRAEFIGPVFDEKINGIRGKGALLHLREFHPVIDIATEPMHMVATGIIKNILATGLTKFYNPHLGHTMKKGMIGSTVFKRLETVHKFSPLPASLVRKAHLRSVSTMYAKENLSFFLTSFISVCEKSPPGISNTLRKLIKWNRFIALCGTIHLLTMLTFSTTAHRHYGLVHKLAEEFARLAFRFHGAPYYRKQNYHRVLHLGTCMMNHGNPAGWSAWEFELAFKYIRRCIRGFHQQIQAYRNNLPFLLHINYATGELIGARYKKTILLKGQVRLADVPGDVQNTIVNNIRNCSPEHRIQRFTIGNTCTVNGMKLNSALSQRETRLFSRAFVDNNSKWYEAQCFVQVVANGFPVTYAVAKPIQEVLEDDTPWTPAPLPLFVPAHVIRQHYFQGRTTNSLIMVNVANLYGPAFLIKETAENPELMRLIACPFACVA